MDAQPRTLQATFINKKTSPNEISEHDDGVQRPPPPRAINVPAADHARRAAIATPLSPLQASAASAAKTRMSRALFSDRHGRRGERLDVQALADEVKGVVTEYVDLADARPEAMQFDTLLDKRQGKLKHYFLVARAKPKYQAILGGTTTAEEQAEWEARAATESLRGLKAQPRGYTTGVEADRAAIARARRRRGGAL